MRRRLESTNYERLEGMISHYEGQLAGLQGAARHGPCGQQP